MKFTTEKWQIITESVQANLERIDRAKAELPDGPLKELLEHEKMLTIEIINDLKTKPMG